jgi:N-hydroxyarylamine O-acetyltransferase
VNPSELDLYFERTGYRGPRTPGLEVLHALTAAHTQTVPFENLDILLGRGIDLGFDAVFDKLVRRRRGGYCFEQNSLFLNVLQTLGFDATPLSARVRLDRPRDFIPPRTHVFIRVMLDDTAWLTDVGVGASSLTSAIAFDTAAEQVTPHERRRILREAGRCFHQIRFGDDWHDVYEFTGEEMPEIDRVVGNWYTSTHPQSGFKSRFWSALPRRHTVRRCAGFAVADLRDVERESKAPRPCASSSARSACCSKSQPHWNECCNAIASRRWERRSTMPNARPVRHRRSTHI